MSMIGEHGTNRDELRLGDITYSNCFPVHARLIDRPRRGDPRLVTGIPSRLNQLLADGEIDVAPCSSIEYALHADRYSILPDLVIGARGPVRSIKFLSRRPPEALTAQRVALPTASATSVVLLKILLQMRWGVQPEFVWFDQANDNPFVDGADAALFIGDVALRSGLHRQIPHRFDLGEEWQAATGLPFAFAVWQTSGGTAEQLRRLHEILLESREFAAVHREELARRYSAHFGLHAPMLAEYWAGLSYHLDEPMVEGLNTFYRFAVAIGAIPAAPELRWVQTG